MTFYYKTTSWSNSSPVNQKTVDFYKHLADKSNWRIVELRVQIAVCKRAKSGKNIRKVIQIKI